MGDLGRTHVEATAHAGIPTAENRPSRAAGRGVSRHYLRNHAWDRPRTPARRHRTADQHRRADHRSRPHDHLCSPAWSAARHLGDGRISLAAGTRTAHRRAPGFGLSVLNLALTTVIFAVVFLGEEIGWRGYLLCRLAEVTSGRRAALLTGAFHA